MLLNHHYLDSQLIHCEMSNASASQSKINHALNGAFDKSVYYFYIGACSFL